MFIHANTSGFRSMHSQIQLGRQSALSRVPRCQGLAATRSVIDSRSFRSDQIFIATVPLVGWETWEKRLQHRFPSALALHCMVLVATRAASQDEVTVLDFLPDSPTAPATAARLLSGAAVQGQLRERRLRKLPNKRCWLVGAANQSAVRYFCNLI